MSNGKPYPGEWKIGYTSEGYYAFIGDQPDPSHRGPNAKMMEAAPVMKSAIHDALGTIAALAWDGGDVDDPKCWIGGAEGDAWQTRQRLLAVIARAEGRSS